MVKAEKEKGIQRKNIHKYVHKQKVLLKIKMNINSKIDGF